MQSFNGSLFPGLRIDHANLTTRNRAECLVVGIIFSGI
jgi:hypothetical protein